MAPYLTPFVLIGGLVVLGLLSGVGLVLLTVIRERADVASNPAAEGAGGGRAAGAPPPARSCREECCPGSWERGGLATRAPRALRGRTPCAIGAVLAWTPAGPSRVPRQVACRSKPT